MAENSAKFHHLDVGFFRRGLVVAVLVYSVIRCRNVLAMEGILPGGYVVGVQKMGMVFETPGQRFCEFYGHLRNMD